MLLRDGTETKDPRLDRLIQFDEKSRAFNLHSDVGHLPFRSFTWSINQWLDQGNEGACVGFTIGHELAGRPYKVKGVTNDYAREQIYYQAQRDDPYPGGEYPGADPVSGGTSVLAGVKAAQTLGHYGEYRWAFGLDDLRRAVGYKGPSIIGVWWREGQLDTDSNGAIHYTGEYLGGHCTLIYSVSEKLKGFRIWNSWGENWGVRGTAFMSFDEMEVALHEDGEACIPVKRYKRNIT